MKLQQKQKNKQRFSAQSKIVAGLSIVILLLAVTFIFNIGNVHSIFGTPPPGKDYISKGSGDWTDQFNWGKGANGKGKGGYPDASDENATIDGHTISLDSDIDVNNLDFNSGGTLNVDSNQKLTVHGTLDLSNGSMNVDDDGSLIIEEGAEIKNMDSTNFTGDISFMGPGGFVDSMVFRVNTSYGIAKLAIHDLKNSSDFTVTHHTSTPPNPDSIVKSSKIKSISHSEYFDINRDAGSKSCKLTLFWDQNTPSHISNLINTNSLVITHYNNNKWENLGQSAFSGSLTGSGYVTSKSFTGFSPFTFSTTSTQPLPVELLYFKAEKKTGVVGLNWATASETNNSHFIVQKSESGENFERLGKVEGQGTTTQKQSYSFVDEEPINDDVVYYRLKQVDYNGSFEYSDITSVRNSSKAGSTSELKISKVYPNPFENQFTVNYQLNSSQPVKIILTGMDGDPIVQKEIEGHKGPNTYQFEEGNKLKNGNYILTLITKDQKVSKRLIKR